MILGFAAGAAAVAIGTATVQAVTSAGHHQGQAVLAADASTLPGHGVLSLARIQQLTHDAARKAAVSGSARTQAGSSSPSASPSASPTASPTPTATPTPSAPVTPVPPSQCLRTEKAYCLGATQLRRLYGCDRLPNQGRGANVGLVLPYINPYAQKNLDIYSDFYHLPRTQLEVINWHGKATVADPNDPNQAIAVEEGALDAQMIHVCAPLAHIVYVSTPTNLLGGSIGMDEVSAAVKWLTDHRHIDVFSASYGTAEDDFPVEAGKPGDYSAIGKLRRGFAYASHRGVTLVASDGDWGPTFPGLPDGDLYKHPVSPWPASDPAFTSVSGTGVQVTDAGERTAPDKVWAEHDGDQAATGGGLSHVFDRPAWQDRAAGVVGNRRGVGDVSMVAATDSYVWFVSEGYNVLGGPAGWVGAGGTSVAAPLFAGIVADTAALARHRLGNINPAITALGAKPAAVTGLADVTKGCNSITGMTGYCARKGYDLPAGGWTVGDAVRFVPALAAMSAARSGLAVHQAAYWSTSSASPSGFTPVGGGGGCRPWAGSYCQADVKLAS
jgi:subtilase family serine protease